MPGMDARARANGYEQRLLGIAEGFAGNLFKLIEVKQDLILNIRIDGLAVLVITGAGLGGDGETLRHRHAQSGHFSQIGTLAAKQLTHFCRCPPGTCKHTFSFGYFLRFD